MRRSRHGKGFLPGVSFRHYLRGPIFQLRIIHVKRSDTPFSARGDQSEASDMDFLVEFERATFDNYFDLKFFLEGLFGRKVDLVIKDNIKPRIRSTILQETVYARGL